MTRSSMISSSSPSSEEPIASTPIKHETFIATHSIVLPPEDLSAQSKPQTFNLLCLRERLTKMWGWVLAIRKFRG